MFTIGRILSFVNCFFIMMGISIYCLIFVFIYRNRLEYRDVSLILTLNTCLSAFLTCLTVLIMIGSNIFDGFLIRNLQFCCVWGLLYDIFECSIYHSYCLQAFYRLCRIVFYKKKFLLSPMLYQILIVIQWMWIFILLIPPLFVHWYIRLPGEYFCLIPYTSILPEVYHILILYLFPLICIIITYLWITLHMRQRTRSQTMIIVIVQRQRNQRDLTVIKRIILIVSILVMLRFPTIIFLLYGIFTGHLYSLTYSIVGLITSICLIIVALITIQITTQFRKELIDFFHRNRNRNRIQIQIENVPIRTNHHRFLNASIQNHQQHRTTTEQRENP